MARDQSAEDFTTPLRRLLLIIAMIGLSGLFLLWRIDSPRVERLRAEVVDRLVPNLEWAMAPVTGAMHILRDFQSYQRIYQQNQELRSELRQMTVWKEAALQLEQENARLRDLNNVQLDPRLTYVSGVVLADSGSPFRQTVLLNVGYRDGIVDGWATIDGVGLVGRIAGVGPNTSRVILLTDAASRVPAIIQPSGQRALVIGDNTVAPYIDFVEDPDRVRPGDRIITSGDGDVFPAGLLLGQIAQDSGGRLRARLAADYERLEILRVLRDQGTRRVESAPGVILPYASEALAPGSPVPEAPPLEQPLPASDVSSDSDAGSDTDGSNG